MKWLLSSALFSLLLVATFSAETAHEEPSEDSPVQHSEPEPPLWGNEVSEPFLLRHLQQEQSATEEQDDEKESDVLFIACFDRDASFVLCLLGLVTSIPLLPVILPLVYLYRIIAFLDPLFN